MIEPERRSLRWTAEDRILHGNPLNWTARNLSPVGTVLDTGVTSTGMVDGDLWFFDRVARFYRLVMPAADPEPFNRGFSFATRSIERVADIGGGTGRALKALPEMSGTVIDASVGMLGLIGDEFEAIQASATTLPVVDGAFDAILIVDALHHIPDVDDVLGECARVLAPGGVVVIRDFDPSTLRGRALVATEHAIGMQSRFFTTDVLSDHLEANGLSPRIVDTGFTYTVVGYKPDST